MKEQQKFNKYETPSEARVPGVPQNGCPSTPAAMARCHFDGKTLVLSAPAYVVKDEVGRTERRLDE